MGMRIWKSIKEIHWLYLVIHAALVAVGILLAQSKSSLVFAIGTSLLAAGLTGWVVFVYIFLSDSLRGRIELTRRLGVRAYFSSRGSSIRQEYESRLSNAKACIDIMGFGQRALLEDLESKFPEWKAKAQVRILLIDPEYPTKGDAVASLRDQDEGQSCGTIASEVRRFIDRTKELQDSRFKVRLYRCLPSVNIFRVDDQLFWGPYFIRRVSRNSPTFVVDRGGELFDDLMSHFDAIWHNDSLSREVPSEWFMP